MKATRHERDSNKPAPSRGRRIFRRVFRWFRISVLLLILFVVASLVHLNEAGLPEFIKRRAAARLEARGWEVQFSRLRLRWDRGIVAEDLQLRRAGTYHGPHIFIEEAQCKLDRNALKDFVIQLDSVRLMGGRLLWPLAVTNQPRETFVVNDIAGQLLFRTNDRWNLRSLSARFLRAELNLSGSITNASAIRDWKFPRRVKPSRVPLDEVLHRIETLAERFHFTSAPVLSVEFHGDARELQTFYASMEFTAGGGTDSPWGVATNTALSARVFRLHDGDAPILADARLTARDARTPWGRARIVRLDAEFEPSWTRLAPTNASVSLQLDGADTRWAKAERLNLAAKFVQSPTNAAFVESDLSVTAQQFASEWGRADRARVTVQAWHPATNWLPAVVSGRARVDDAQTRWGGAQQAMVFARGSLPERSRLSLLETNLPWPDRLANLPLEITATFTNIQSPKLRVDDVALTAEWQSPQFRLTVNSDLAGGKVDARVSLDAATREFSFGGTSSCDAQQIAPLLTTNAQQWLANYSWRASPKVEAEGRLTLPAWTNRHPDWRGEVLPTLSLAGKFDVGEGGYRGLPFSAARSPFNLTNMYWRLPEMRVTRPEGTLEADYSSDQRTRDFRWRLRSRIDLKAARPLLTGDAQTRVMDFFQFTTPPDIRADVWGRWGDLDRLGVVAEVALANAAFRGQTVETVHAHADYTNKVFTILAPTVTRAEGREHGAADGLRIDLVTQKLWLTNAHGRLDPQAVARAIGEKSALAIAPYQFDTPPTGRVDGVVDLQRRRYEDDMRFQVAGGPFHWQQFHLPQIQGLVHWQGQRVVLTNVQGEFHSGQAAGWGRFDFAGTNGTEFAFNARVAEANLRSLMADVGNNKTNKLDGTFSGELAITSANTSNVLSWQGQGHAALRDGLIWEIPIFGVFSPVLNAIVPGLGHSRAKAATATFIITNSVIHTADLEIRALAMRMHYDGSVDFQRRVNGRMEAELLRDVPGFGVLFSKIFWPVTKVLEYKVTGTLAEPKTEPLYTLPKILMMPLHPFKTIKELFTKEEKEPSEKQTPPP